jgi:hypothetical protein
VKNLKVIKLSFKFTRACVCVCVCVILRISRGGVRCNVSCIFISLYLKTERMKLTNVVSSLLLNSVRLYAVGTLTKLHGAAPCPSENLRSDKSHLYSLTRDVGFKGRTMT